MNAATKEEKRKKWNHSPNRNGNRLNIFQCVNTSPSSTVNNDWLTQKYLKMQWFLFRLVCATAAHCTDGGSCRKKPARVWIYEKERYQVQGFVCGQLTPDMRSQESTEIFDRFRFFRLFEYTIRDWISMASTGQYFAHYRRPFMVAPNVHAIFGHCVISITQSWRRLKLDDIFNLWF